MKPLVIIPARLQARRLPNKPLADIGGRPMIVAVWERAMAADLGRVVVAAGDREIAEAVKAHGGEVVLTDPAHPSGSDRVREAAERLDPERACDVIVNLQGDLPLIDPDTVRAAIRPLSAMADADIATLAAPIEEDRERDDPSVVKAIISAPDGGSTGRALYFTRATAPTGDGPLYHHIGIYAFRRPALERFITLPPSPLETRERLEQLRALEHGMKIGIEVVHTVPLGVDTPDDLERARALSAKRPASAQAGAGT